jgi:TPR repeat protein
MGLRPAWLYNRSLEYLDSKGVPKDAGRAFELNSQSAELGFHDAVLAMGWFYLNGLGVEEDVAKAEAWYRRSARQGDPRAMFSLGQMAYVARDYSEARRWLERAQNKGHHRSTYWLGKLYWRGHGVSKDQAEAMRLFQQAAQMRNPEAKRVLKVLARSKCRRTSS